MIELGLWKWFLEHIAIPLLGGMWSALAWWVHTIGSRFSRMEERHSKDAEATQKRLSDMDQRNADTYARQDYVRDGFGRIEGKLDLLVKHALGDRQG